jgi:2-dehydro-3-deoxyphosphogluconate aldolase/(4S)-4-hydroxy-2-oxoglutarate aldolase
MPVVPGLRLMITGGVEPTEQNLSAWFNAGAFCVGMGSQLFTKDIVQQRDWDALKKSIVKALNVVQEIRK